MSALQDERVVPNKRNVVSRPQIVQDRREPTPTLEFLIVIVDCVGMTLILSKRKVLRVQNQCKANLEK